MSDNNSTGYVPSFDTNHFLDGLAGKFETGATGMMSELVLAEKELQKNPSDPSVLASYQSKLQTYTLFRNAQTSSVKAYKDIGAAIIQNFR